MRRALSALLCLTTAVGVALSAPSPSAAEGPKLDKPRHGADAVRALGDHLPEVARLHQATTTELRDRLHRDDALWVDVDGRLFYVDAAPTASAESAGTSDGAAGASVTAAPPGQELFALHSLPGARRTVYLDFDGVGGSYGGAIGAAWSSRTYTGGDGVAEPYTLDSDLTTFNADERADIYSTWLRVAEDFVPFGIDVTTQEPAFERINRSGPSDEEYGTRVAITSTAQSCSCGGVAYVGVFDEAGSGTRAHARFQPAFVYTRGAKFVAEAATHEAGHNLGLSHDGDAAAEYYPGHDDWAPIMGVSYHRAVTQWSKGEYAGANNVQDDFAVAAANGGEPRLDSTVPPLTLGGSVTGSIERAGDTDEVTLTVPGDAATTVTITVAPALISPNLDVSASISPSAGTAFDAPNLVPVSGDVVGGLGSTLTGELAPGTYTVTVGATGFGNPASTGYSAYGSVGGYSVTAAAGPAVVRPVPATPVSFSAALAPSSSISLTWAGAPGETSYQLRRYSVANGVDTLSRTQPVAADRTTFTEQPGAGTWRYELAAVNPSGASAWTSRSTPITVAAPSKGGGKK